MKEVDLLIVNASELLTLAGPDRPRSGAEMRDNGAVAGGALAADGGVVVEAGETAVLTRKYCGRKILDAEGRLVMPGFIDPHTHLVFAGSRENEMVMRQTGLTYLDILNRGGGIHATVAATRKTEFDELMALSRRRIRQMFDHGTTAVEIKTGYGLDEETEGRLLRVINALKQEGPLDVISTFLGAHTVPSATNRNAYVDWIIHKALERFKDQAEFCDVFCEEGAFTLEESRKILETAAAAGYKLKIHAGQFHDLGAAGMAASLDAVSAEHLDRISPAQLDLMRSHGTVAILLPGASFFLNSQSHADFKMISDHGVPVALATDFNPGSCPCFSMQMMIALAVRKLGMTAEEAVTASTFNAAWAVDRGKQLGSLEPGKQADLILLDVQNAAQIPYYFGTNLVRTVVKRGEVGD
ncbi:imidazolonepropionase [bacterium]|nr:imidazolonepropionase [bacterium]